MPADGEIEIELDQTVTASIEPHSTIPACLANPTLGAAANGVFLDVADAQLIENRAAEIEGRPARIAKRDFRHPNYNLTDVHSGYSDVTFGTHYDDGELVTNPQGGPEIASSGNVARAHAALENALGGTPQAPDPKVSQAPQDGPATPEAPKQAPSRAPRGSK